MYSKSIAAAITPGKPVQNQRLCLRMLADEALIIDIQQFFEDSHGIYGNPRIHSDLREAGTRCGVKRVARLMRQVQIKSVRGYKLYNWPQAQLLKSVEPNGIREATNWKLRNVYESG